MNYKGHIVVFGKDGKLGKEVVRIFQENTYLVEAYSSHDAPIHHDISKSIICGMQHPLQIDGPNLVINCAAYTNVDEAERFPESAYISNAFGPTSLAISCLVAKIPLIHISTDYVFCGDSEHRYPYIEADEPWPISIYGKSKLLGEKNVQEICPQHWIFRTSGLYGREGEGFPQRIIEKSMESNDPVNGSAFKCDNETQYCPTWAPELARVILEVFEKKIPFGLYHACGAATSPYLFAVDVLDTWKKRYQYPHDVKLPMAVWANAANEGRAAKRPIYSVMSCEKLKKAGVEPPNRYSPITIENWKCND